MTYYQEYYKKNKELIRDRSLVFYKKNKESILKRQRLHYAKPEVKERQLFVKRRRRFEIMDAIFTNLGNECSLCGVKNKVLLQIDHIDGGGHKHHKSVKGGLYKYYGSIKKSVEDGEGKYRLLCANCNISECVRKGFRGSIWVDEFFKKLLK